MLKYLSFLKSSLFILVLFYGKSTFSQSNSNNTSENKYDYSGKNIVVESAIKIKGKKLKLGDQIKFQTSEPFVVDGKTIINKGTEMIGHVVKIKKPRSLGKEGNFEFVLDDFMLSDKIKLKFTNNTVEGNNMVGLVVLDCLFIGPFALLFQGTQGVIKKGEKYICYIQ